MNTLEVFDWEYDMADLTHKEEGSHKAPIFCKNDDLSWRQDVDEYTVYLGPLSPLPDHKPRPDKKDGSNHININIELDYNLDHKFVSDED